MNALRVVALRLQNMKGQLEQLNEPVDDLMEVSKVQTQILNLTGNRVDIFDSATQQFRSTYDILKDISEVWDSLTSVNRASLTEILFGKNRANTGLAIIQAFQSGQIESAFEASMDSMGTAVEENERLMQGLQAQLDALKGSFQNLANAALKSSLLKTILQSAGSLLDVLTKIVDTVGALPPLLGTIGAVAGAKGFNMLGILDGNFGTLNPQLQNASVAIKEYNRAMSQLNTTSGYQAVIQRTIGGEVAANDAVFKKYITNLNGAKASMSGYTSQLVAAKTKTVALQVATVAMNAIISVGIGLAISAAVSAISKLIHAEENERKKQEELRAEYAKTAKERKQEVKSLNDALANYTKISTTVTDVTDREKQLSDLQDTLIDKFGEKAKALDLVNDKYAEGIEKMQQFSLAEAEEYVAEKDRTGAYKKAVQELSESYKPRFSLEGNEVSAATDLTRQGMARVKASELTGFNPAFIRAVDKEISNVIWQEGQFGVQQLYVTGTLKEQEETLKRIAILYQDAGGQNDKTLQRINEQANALNTQITNNELIIQQYEAAQKLISDLKLPEETQKQFNDLIAQAKEFNDIATGDGSTVEKFEAVQKIDEIQSKLYELAGSNETIRGTIKTVFSEFITGSKTGVQAIEDLTGAWYENLEELKKGTIKEIDSVKAALQTVAGGGTISASDFWELSKIDTDHILDGAKMVGDQFQLTEEQLIKLKDTYIQKQIESLKIEMETAKVKQQEALTEAALYQNQLNNWKFAEKNLNNPAYRKEYNTLKANLQTATDNAKQYGETWRLNNTLLMYYNSQLGNTVDRQKQLTDLTKKLQDEADNLLKAQEYRIDQIIDKFEDEKEAIEDAKSVLEDQLSVLEEQESALKDTIENYKSVAELVQETIQDQIDAIKEQNEAREESLDLAQKLANLENARNNKVRVYTEAGGWQYEAKKSDVQKAERELEKAKTDSDIKELEKYLKKWQSLGDKAKKEADERLAVEILGADWREKISVQDEEIFNKYEDEYDAYGAQLWHISNIEIATVKKSIEVKNQEIAAKEAQITEWQKYKSEVQKAANDAKNANESYMQYLNTVTINENSTLQDRENNLTRFRDTYAGILSELTAKQNELNQAANNYDTGSMQSEIDELKDAWSRLAEIMKENHQANSASEAELWYGYKVGGYADGGVNSRTGIAMLHGTKQKSETIFNANDSAKLYDLVHSTPNLVATALTDGASIARGLTNTSTDSRSVTLNGTTINLPNVQNAEQFARQFEAYMQTLLSESQVYKPSR